MLLYLFYVELSIIYGKIIEMIFPQNGVRCIAINGGLDSAQGNNDLAPLRNLV